MLVPRVRDHLHNTIGIQEYHALTRLDSADLRKWYSQAFLQAANLITPAR